MPTPAWLVFAFLCGALPFSVWLSHLTGVDSRQVGDGNPGATNALKAGGKWLGLAVLLLDVSKSAAPVGLARQIFHLQGWPMLLIAFAPLLGHAYSPFLRFRGGKALAAALGAWIGLTLWEIPALALASLTFWFLIFKKSGWSVLLTLLMIGLYLIIFHPDPLLLQTLGLQSALLLWKQRREWMRP